MKLSLALFILSTTTTSVKGAGVPPYNSGLARKRRLMVIAAAGMAAAGSGEDSSSEDKGDNDESAREGYPARKRSRRSVYSILLEQGDEYFKRAYRMDYPSFKILHSLLEPALEQATDAKAARNGLIHSTVRLSCALRYFAGGSAYDIALVHGVSHSEVFNSVWKVVDAVLACEALSFEFPKDHGDQKQLAHEFKMKSEASFDNCCGAIDGMLVWMEKPSLRECELAKVGQLKFFCGRKHKYGFNLQGLCDAKNRFLDVAIKHPAATSDYLAFTTSRLYHDLEQDNFLADGLSIYGDNAYVNCSYMTTPFKNVKSGVLDDYNFYQSQLRIRIECTFGMLVCRWGILRRPIPSSVGLQKTAAMTMALCRLHNFCVGRNLMQDTKTKRSLIDSFNGDQGIAPALAVDDAEIMCNGGSFMYGVNKQDTHANVRYSFIEYGREGGNVAVEEDDFHALQFQVGGRRYELVRKYQVA